jgi:hypothetical protein
MDKVKNDEKIHIDSFSCDSGRDRFWMAEALNNQKFATLRRHAANLTKAEA